MMQPVMHFELPYDDLERAKEFYTKAFGWEMSDWPMADGVVYPGIRTTEADENGMPKVPGAVMGGGFVPRTELEMPSITMSVKNATEVAEQAVAAGATKISEQIFEGMGKIIYLKDTESNLIGLWEDANKEEEKSE